MPVTITFVGTDNKGTFTNHGCYYIIEKELFQLSKIYRNRSFIMFRYCPSCASVNIRFEGNKKFVCPNCGFTYYHNTAAAAACIVCTGPADDAIPRGIVPGEEVIVFLVRGMDPASG
jgi:hypothetical protein